MSEPINVVGLNNALLESNMITQQLIESGGEITPEMESYIKSLDFRLMSTVDTADLTLTRLDMEQDYFKGLADQYYKAARALENFKSRLKEEIKQTMIIHGFEEITGQNVRMKLTRTNPKLIIDGELPEKYKVQVVTTEIKKDAIKEDLKEGLCVEGAHLEESYALRTYVNVARK